MGLSAVVITDLVCSAAVCRPLSELQECVTSEGVVNGLPTWHQNLFVSGEGIADTATTVHGRNMKAAASVFCVHRSWVRVSAHRRAAVMA
jgi:hypothetical protein